MQQLGSTDSSYLKREAPGRPQHISSILVYAPPDQPHSPIQYREVLEAFDRNLHKSAIFRQRLQRVPLGLDNPYWIADDRFDLDYHVRHVALPQPGTWTELCQIAARLHAVPLDMERPLWEAYVIDGLNDLAGYPPGAYALLLKVHNSAAGSCGLERMIEMLHRDMPEPRTLQPSGLWQPEPPPTKLNMLFRAYTRQLRPLRSLADLAGHVYPDYFRRARNESEVSQPPAATRFNQTISGERVTGLLQIPKQSLRDISATISGTTAYDALISIIGGALREYLLEKNELPDTSLTLTMPMDRPGSAPRPDQSTRSMLSMATHLAEPLARLRAVAASRARAGVTPSNSAAQAATILWPNSEYADRQSTGRITTWLPDRDAYLTSTRLSLVMAMPTINDNMGLAHSVLGYNAQISLMFVACRAMLPDPERYTRCLARSLEQHSDAARTHDTP